MTEPIANIPLNRIPVTADDSRLADARTPTSHKHTVDDIEGTGTRSAATYFNGAGGFSTPPNTNTTYAIPSEAEITTGTATTARAISANALKGAIQRWATGSYAVVISTIGQALNRAANAAEARTAIGAVADNDSRLTDARTPTAHTHTLASLGAVADNDSRLSNARTPTAHTHTIANVTGLQAALDDASSSGAGVEVMTRAAFNAIIPDPEIVYIIMAS